MPLRRTEFFFEHIGGLAQLARAPALQAGGQGFDSLALHKKGIIFDGPFFVESKGGKCAAFSFPTPIPTFPSGKAWSLRAEAPKGVWFGRGSFVRAVVDSGARFGCVVTDGRWLAPRGWVRVWCLYLCGRNGGVLRYLVPLWRCVSAVGRSTVFVGWIVSPCPCRNGSDLRDLVPLRRLVIARG